MKTEIKEKIMATNQKYLKKFLTEEAPAKLESQLEHMDWSYLDMIHNKEQQRGAFSPLAAMELLEIEANKDKYLATGLDAVKNGKVGAILLAGGQGTRLGFDKAKGMFNIGKTKELYIFEQLIANLMKVTNQITPEFLAQVEQNAQKLPYTHLETRDSAILRIPDKKDAFLYWIDALGVEYLSYIAILAKKKGLSIHVDIAYVELPTITSINKGFFEKWAGSKKEKEPRLDEIKHKEEGGYFYRPGQAPVHLASELEVIRKSIDRAATELAMHTCKTFVIASDHGASRLAVIHHQEEKYDTDTKGEHSGRCCKEFADADLPQAICENGYLVLADYGRFKNSRAANVEVHGGASLEEVIVPIITLSLKKQCDLIIELLNADEVYCDRRLGTTIQLYISDADNTQSISVVIDEKRYAAKGSDKTHYEVNLYDMRRAKKNVSAAIYDGDDLIGTVHFDIKGKMATVNNDFDDLF